MTQCVQANATTSLTNPKATARHTTTRAAHYLAHASISVSQLLDSHKQDGNEAAIIPLLDSFEVKTVKMSRFAVQLPYRADSVIVATDSETGEVYVLTEFDIKVEKNLSQGCPLHTHPVQGGCACWIGKVVVTPGALDAADSFEISQLLGRHVAGDWGDVPGEDWIANDEAVLTGGRLLSSYMTRKEEKIWIITEWDRSVTTLLLPSEY